MYREGTENIQILQFKNIVTNIDRINTTYSNAQFESKFVDGIGLVLVEVEKAEVLLSDPFLC